MIDDILIWLGTHPFQRPESNIIFWICVIALALIAWIVWWGGKGSGRMKG